MMEIACEDLGVGFEGSVRVEWICLRRYGIYLVRLRLLRVSDGRLLVGTKGGYDRLGRLGGK